MSNSEKTFIKDSDMQIADGDFKYLFEATRTAVMQNGSVLTWMDSDESTRRNLKGVGFEPPPGKLVKVNDPDGKVTWWNIEDDEYVVEDIEDRGSVIAYVEHPKLRRKFKTYQFRIPKAELVSIIAERSEYEDSKENKLLIVLGSFDSLIVVGMSRDKYDSYRCFSQSIASKRSGYEYEKWFYSMLDLASDSKTNCFLFAERRFVSDTKRERYREMFATLFPDMKVLFRRNGVTISLSDINTALIE